MVIRTKRGLDLPIGGTPRQQIEQAPSVSRIAVVGADYPGLRPALQVQVGDRVQAGQVLFTDRKTAGVQYTAPAAGTVLAIERGEKRRFLSLVIELGGDEHIQFTAHGSDLSRLTRSTVVDQLVQSGGWTALRTRPFSKVPDPDSAPHSIFVTAMDTNPLAADPEVIIAEQPEAFIAGLHALTTLSDGPCYLCTAPSNSIPGADVPGVEQHTFSGPHPSGLAGTHIHFLDPVSSDRTVWYIHYQDVIAIGNLMHTGRIDSQRVISLAGPLLSDPRLVRVTQGSEVGPLLEGELTESLDETDYRIVSGSLLSGRTARAPLDFLGRYHSQISVLREGGEREFLGWQRPGWNRFSIKRAFAAALSKRREFDFTTTSHGSERAMVPIGCYEKVMPLDILPTFLLRALIVGDTQQAQLLGCLELDEEDIALCTFVCPGKHEFGPILRDNLTRIEKEG